MQDLRYSNNSAVGIHAPIRRSGSMVSIMCSSMLRSHLTSHCWSWSNEVRHNYNYCNFIAAMCTIAWTPQPSILNVSKSPSVLHIQPLACKHASMDMTSMVPCQGICKYAASYDTLYDNLDVKHASCNTSGNQDPLLWIVAVPIMLNCWNSPARIHHAQW